MGPSGINVSDVLSISFMTMEDPEDLIRIIKSMDGVWLEWQSREGDG